MTRLILLDRDGVINFDSPDYVKRPEEWIPIPGALRAVVRLKQAGFLVAVCTNQAGVGRGILTSDALQAIHGEMHARLAREGAALDGLVFCPHHPDEGCGCRKPNPGMLLQMMQQLRVGPEQTVYVGDSLKDAQAAALARCSFALVRTGNGAGSEGSVRELGVRCVFDDLAAFAAAAIQEFSSC